MRVFFYVLGAWHDPDSCEQGVPWVVDETEIFFGPCKRPLRALLRREYLKDQQRCDLTREDVFLVGLNAANNSRQRKIIWVGKITSLMTFAHAWRTLVDERYDEMRADLFSPLHLEPLFEGGRHVGYRHVSQQHAGEWLLDLTAKRSSLASSCVVTEDEVRVNAGHSPSELFDRDACFLLERHFVANGKGIELSTEMLDVLRDAGFLRPGDVLDAYAVFGNRADGSADGKTGSWVEVDGPLARRFIDLVSDEGVDEPGEPLAHSKRPCDC